MVSRFAAASAKCMGMKTTPTVVLWVSQARSTIVPRRDETRTAWPSSIFRRARVRRIDFDARLGIELVQLRMARHRAAVPVFEQAPGGEDERIFVIGPLHGGTYSSG